jgi:hypothetical protein
VKVEGFIFCVSVGTSSPARVCYQCIKNFHQKSFFFVVIGAVLRVMARRTSLAHHIFVCQCYVVSRVPVVSKFDDGTVVRHYRNWAFNHQRTWHLR